MYEVNESILAGRSNFKEAIKTCEVLQPLFWKKYKLHTYSAQSEDHRVVFHFDKITKKFDYCVMAFNKMNPGHPERAEVFRRETVDELIAWLSPRMNNLQL